MTDIMHRRNVILSAVAGAWLTTTDIHAHLVEHGFPWSSTITRDTLHYLALKGEIERRKVGVSWQWRRTPEPEVVAEPAPADANEHVAALVETIKHLANTLGVPLALLAPPSEQRAADLSDVLSALAAADPDGPDLAHLHEALLKRAIRRAAYDMGKALLDVLNGWIKGVVEENESMGRSDRPGPEAVPFLPEDIRRMVNDAARIMGAPEPYRPAVR